MRMIRRTTASKRDHRREKKGRLAKTLDADLMDLLPDLAADRALNRRHRDHALTGP